MATPSNGIILESRPYGQPTLSLLSAFLDTLIYFDKYQWLRTARRDVLGCPELIYCPPSACLRVVRGRCRECDGGSGSGRERVRDVVHGGVVLRAQRRHPRRRPLLQARWSAWVAVGAQGCAFARSGGSGGACAMTGARGTASTSAATEATPGGRGRAVARSGGDGWMHVPGYLFSRPPAIPTPLASIPAFPFTSLAVDVRGPIGTRAVVLRSGGGQASGSH
ncbi:hypothetical protein FIBSPDRAFT_890297 [Athelia psychrophila]|uniref:Uncharacterized protein n=1 Tax=Athelia psychrophila TaxID=1759441 RepID=A0A166L8E7_9AGAM|nr:hypothetical protein FIBSPDRAFT_890297 [Fibularhizoctonia sp. CBS 109695]